MNSPNPEITLTDRKAIRELPRHLKAGKRVRLEPGARSSIKAAPDEIMFCIEDEPVGQRYYTTCFGTDFASAIERGYLTLEDDGNVFLGIKADGLERVTDL